MLISVFNQNPVEVLLGSSAYYRGSYFLISIMKIQIAVGIKASTVSHSLALPRAEGGSS